MDFLDKLEQLLINSPNLDYFIDKSDEPGEKDTMFIGSGNIYQNENTPKHMKQLVNFLRFSDIESQYDFVITFFSKYQTPYTLMEEILTLNPTDEDLFLLYQKLRIQEEEVPSFINLFKDKNNFINSFKKGNHGNFYIENDKEFLQECFVANKAFELSLEDYYNIFYHYIKNSHSIRKKDRLFSLILDYIDDNILLENLFECIYGERINIADGITSKTVEKIDINILSFMKNYKFIAYDDIDKLLSFFVDSMRNHLDKLQFTTDIQSCKSINKYSNFSQYSLIVETTNIQECKQLLNLYLKYFVDFNQVAENFVKHVKNNKTIFENFILYKKLHNKLDNKHIKTESKKI